MKRINFSLFISMAMLMLSFNSAWGQYVKVTNGETVSWIEIEGTINGTNIEIYKSPWESAIESNTKGSINLNEVWSQTGGNGIHYQVTSIGQSAFSNCSGLTSVVIPSSVTSIGSSAFYISKNAPNIAIYSWQDDFSVANSITFADGATITITGNPDKTISKKNRITVDGTEYVSMSVSNGYENTYVAPAGKTVSSITFYSYVNKDAQTDRPAYWKEVAGVNYTVEESGELKSFKDGANPDVRSFTLETPASTVTFTNSGEQLCYVLVVEFCENLKDIFSEITDVFNTGTNAFKGCENAILHVPVGTSNEYRNREDWNRIHQIKEAAYVKVIAENGMVSWVDIQGDISGATFNINKKKYSYDNSFYTFTTAIDPSSKGILDLNEVWSQSGGRGTHYQVTSIENQAFNGCSGLTSVVIPSSVTSIGGAAFSDCSGLTSVVIPSSVTSIGNEAFSGCNNLATVTINSNAILSKSYSSSSNFNKIFGSQVTEYVLGVGVTNIGKYAFYGCSGLTSVIIPSGVTSIGDYAFYGCSGLTSLVIPSSVTSIRDYAFYGCSGLTSLVVPSGVTSIRDGVFMSCSGLTSVIIPSRVTSIGLAAFYGCSGLTSVEIPSSLTSIGSSAFYGCSGLTSVDIPSRVTSIGNYTFQGCSGLTFVDIPSSVTSIGDYAFYGCRGLKSVSIPNSVTSIGSYAFQNCNNVTDIYSKIKDVFVTGTNAFLGCENATLHVPAGTYVAYSGRADWNRIVHVVEDSEGFKMTMACNTKGYVLVNDETNFTSVIGEVDVKEQEENTFVFTPKANCKLEQVVLNGLDVTASIENNTLKAVIPAKSQMVVTFANESGDMNNDGIINISDVVLLVNMILGQ